MRPVVYLDISELLVIARLVNGDTGAIRDEGALQAAAYRPRATVFGVEAYLDLFGKAAALLHSLARNDPLVDGNKRTAFLAASLMLELNGVLVGVFPDAQEKAMNDIAQGFIELDDIARLLRKWAQ